MAKTQVDTHPIRFYFSFRSPYAWIAARHVLPMVTGKGSEFGSALLDERSAFRCSFSRPVSTSGDTIAWSGQSATAS